MRSDICLLLTSTIEVACKDFVKRHDTYQRLEDCKEALGKWLTRQEAFRRIIFVDNSGYPLGELQHLTEVYDTKDVEFMSFHQTDYCGKGKSYGELRIVGYALDHSRIMAGCEYFAKVTGRIFVRNIDSILTGIPDQFDFISNFTNNLAYTDTTLILFRRSTYVEKIRQIAESVVYDERREYLERAYAKAILLAIAEDYRWFPLPEEPIIEGMSGTKNKPYGRGWLKSLQGTFLSRLYHNFYRTSYGKNRSHLLEVWGVPPGGNAVTDG